MTIGAQMYTLRAYTQVERDLAEALGRVAGMGYDSIQLSAIGPIKPELIRRMADDNGLAIVLTHVPEARILGDTDAVIREHDALGCKYIGLGAMGERYRDSAWADRFYEDFRLPMERIAAAGKLFMYHNHAFEFERMRDGHRLIELLMQIPPGLMGITLDTYWVQYAGGPVLSWIERLRDRIHCVHLKDMTIRGFENRMAPVGSGNMDFQAIVRLLEELGATEHLLVEQDDCYGEDPFECLHKSREVLRQMSINPKR